MMPGPKKFLIGKKINFIFQIINKIVIILCTLFNRYQFYSWGEGSRIEPSAKLISPYLICVGCNVSICEHAWLNAKDNRGDDKPTLTIGDGTYIGRFVHINAWQDVFIEDHVVIADRVYISDADHNYEDTEVPIRIQGDFFKGAVRLRKGCWLGIGSVILPGVTIGRNSIVAANSVVRKDVPDYTIVSGNPATVIKFLKRNE